MGRYDAGWRETFTPRRYDQPFRSPRDAENRVGYGLDYGNRQSGFGGRRGGTAGDSFREGNFRGAEEFGADESRGVYGPARYGLGPYHERLRQRKRSDEELKEEVEEALFYDTWVDADAITVEVKDGIATLRGELPSYDEIRYATDDVWDVDGVRGVRSELSVKSE